MAPTRGGTASPWAIETVMTARRSLALALFFVWLAPLSAAASGWGGITPGESDIDSVRGLYGAPSREQRQKEEGYDTLLWIYEREKAPRGFVKMEVSFGLLTANGYRPRLVRYLRLEPHAGIFTKETVLTGWGAKRTVGKEKNHPVFFYKDHGLVVYFDEKEVNAVSMMFTLPQPDTPPSR